jgi:hypothetical protein
MIPYDKIITDMPEWRNGRRTRLKIWRWQHRAGSSPASGTTKTSLYAGWFLFFQNKSREAGSRFTAF